MGSAAGIEIRILDEDALAYSVEVLVLKHAQASYGLDEQVVGRIGMPTQQLPIPGGYRMFREPSGVAAGAVMFIGVKPLREFSYPDIREFGYKALCSVASAVPHATEVALTLHGVGYGLDEVACFEAIVAGLLDAVRDDDIPRGLRVITFLELNAGRAARMRRQLEALTGSGTESAVFPRTPDGSERAAPGSERLRDVARRGVTEEHAFVAMPFDAAFSDLFHYGLSSAVRAAGLLCERIDQEAFTGDILTRLKDQIRRARIVIADLTGANANVVLEVGFAWGSGVPTVLVCREGSPLKFDVRGQRCLYYTSIHDLETKLKAELDALLETEAR